MKRYILFFPALVLLGGILLFYFTDLSQCFTLDTIRREHARLAQDVKEYPILSALSFILLYVISVYCVIPDSMILSILGGFLFPLPLAILYISFSETLGALLFFLTTQITYTQLQPRHHLLKYLPRRFHHHVNHTEYKAPLLLFFRLSHLLPFWVINLLAGCLNVSWKTFTWTTWIGVLPLAIILAEGGSHLNHYMATHDHFSLFTFLDTNTRILLVAFALLALIPLLFKRR